MGTSRRWSLLLLMPLALQLSCLEFAPPVEEAVHIHFLPGGGVEVTVETVLADPRTSFQDQPKAKARLDEAQWEALNGKDAWARRFSKVDWAGETFSWEKRGGNLIQVRRTGRLHDASKLAEVLGDLPLSVKVRRGESFGELAIYPLDPAGGTAEQRLSLDAFVEKWLPSVGAYLSTETEIYRYLQEHPERARPVFAELFEECLGKEGEYNLEKVPEEERSLMENLGDSFSKVLEALETGKEDEYSADELSRRFYDPLPAPLTVELPGPIGEVVGFERAGNTGVRYRGTGLWPALEVLVGRWASPDVITLLVPCFLQKGSDKAPPWTLGELLARPRRFETAPSSEELRRAFDEALKPAPVYRVTWHEAPGGEPTKAPVSTNSPAPGTR